MRTRRIYEERKGAALSVSADNEFDLGFATKGARVGAGLVSLFHDALGLGGIDARKDAVQFDGEVVAAGMVFQKMNDGADFRIAQFDAESFGSVLKSAVVTGRISGGEKMFGIRPAALDPFLERVTKSCFQESVRGFDRAGAAACGNGFGCNDLLHD